MTDTTQSAANEERYQRTFENATIGMAHLASDGSWIRVNDQLCEILGYEAPELLAKRYAEVSHIDDLEVDVKQWELLRRGEISDFGVERRFVTKRGDVIHADVRLVREDDESGNLLHYIAVIQDITGRKRSEATLRVYERALAATQNGVLISDASQRDNPVIYANQAFLEITGYSEAEVLGRNCRFLNQRSRDQAALDEVRQALQDGTECSVLLRNHRKGGEAFWNRLSIAPVRDDDGVLTHFVGIQSDVTEQVHAVAEREELLASAEAANRAKDRLLSVVSHELRSPLNAVLAWTSILREEANDVASVSRAAEAIEASVRGQTRLVNDLLDVSRIRSRKLEVEPYGIDLGAAVRGAIDQLTPVASEQGVALELRVEPQEVHALADPERIGQIVRNLVENALKFTPRGGHVEVALTGDAEQCQIEVCDTGRGIAVEDLPQIFDEFWQALEGSGGRKGLGLGLPIVKHLVERHGGTVHVESEGIDRGACFRVSLPRAGGTLALRGVAPKGTEDRDLRGAEIVVVDDDRATVEALSSVLAKAGGVPRTAMSFGEALEHFESGTPEILVSDIGLPHRDGIDLIHAVRALEEPKRSVLAMAVTGLADRDERRRIQRAGYDTYLAKPVEPAFVVERLASLRSLAASPPPTRRVLVVGGGSAAAEIVRQCVQQGHAVRGVADGIAAVSESVDFEPELVFVCPPVAERGAGKLAQGLANLHVRAPLVGVLGSDGAADPTPFHFVLGSPVEPAALERLLRFGVEAS